MFKTLKVVSSNLAGAYRLRNDFEKLNMFFVVPVLIFSKLESLLFELFEKVKKKKKSN